MSDKCPLISTGKNIYLELAKPLFTFVSFLLAESKVNKVGVSFGFGCEWDDVFLHMAEVIASICVV